MFHAIIINKLSLSLVVQFKFVIQNFNKDEIQISINEALIKINKKKKEIVATFKENIYFLNCEVENFKI